MDKRYFETHLNFEASPKAAPTALVQAGSYRITVLFDSLFRVEFDPNEQFEDRPTQTFWFRSFTTTFDSSIQDDIISIKTASWHLQLDQRKQDLKGLSLTSLDDTMEYEYGVKDKGNLNGTYRTLDQVDGAVELEMGLLSKDGISVYDDANGVVFENGEIVGTNQDTNDLYLFAYGRDYTSCLKDFYRISGKTPLIPRYALGNWWSRYWTYTDSELCDLVRNFQQRDIPLSVCIIDMDWHITDVPQELGGGWTGYTWNKDLFPDPTKTMNWLKEQGLAVSLNLHPADGIRPFDDCYNDVCQTMGLDPKDEQIIPFDLTNSKFVEAYFKDVHRPLEQQGVDFWWIDWQQGTTSKLNNLDPLFALNHYHFLDGVNHGKDHNMIFSRWSKLGSHRYPIGFSGDTFTTWDSLAFQPYFTANASNVGYGWWSHDIGGHQGGTHDEELYTRWVQYGVFSPIMRLHSTKSYYSRREPWRYNLDVETTVAHFMRLRHQMIPYLHTFNHFQSHGDLPLVRPLYYEYPFDKEAYRHQNQYFFGSELMVRPFTSKTIKKLRMAKEDVWFKEGGWFHFFSDEYIKTPGSYTFYGSLQDINVFAKAGAIVPFATTKNALQDMPDALVVHVFLGNDNTFTLIEDNDGTTYHTTFDLTYKNQEASFTISTDTTAPIMRTLTIEFHATNLRAKIQSDDASIQIKQAKRLCVQLEYNMSSSVTINLTHPDGLLRSSYDFQQDIMDSIDRSALDTEVKNDIGYISTNAPRESRGWLSWDKPLKEKLDDIDNLNIPKYVKRYLRDTTIKHLKNI